MSLLRSQCTLSPSLDLGADKAICPGDALILSAGDGYLTYAWSNGATVPSTLVNTSGAYVVVVQDSNGCFGSDTVIVAQAPAAELELGPDLALCINDSAQLHATPGAWAYLWNDNTTDQDLWVYTSGTYVCTILNEFACSATDSVHVAYYAYPPVINFSLGIAFCEGDSGALVAPEGFASYLWSNGMTGSAIVVVDGGDYTVEVRNVAGCATTSMPITVLVNALPERPVISGGLSGLLASGGGTYAWYFNGDLIAGATSASLVPAQTGTYAVEVTNAAGCLSERSENFEVVFQLMAEDIVQVFSPDGDGINDQFYIHNLSSFPQNTLKVMNRWGNEVFAAKPYLGDWNGNSANGQPLPVGTYYYRLEAGDGSQTLTGSVHIAR
jgi:gliding motility-associated-like protein